MGILSPYSNPVLIPVIVPILSLDLTVWVSVRYGLGDGLDNDSLSVTMATASGGRNRTRGVKKRSAGTVGTALTRASADQGDGLGHGHPEEEHPKAPVTFSTGLKYGYLNIKRGKVDR